MAQRKVEKPRRVRVSKSEQETYRLMAERAPRKIIKKKK